jgi:hypothetical protein
MVGATGKASSLITPKQAESALGETVEFYFLCSLLRASRGLKRFTFHCFKKVGCEYIQGE